MNISGGLLSKGKELASYNDLADMSLRLRSEGHFEGMTVLRGVHGFEYVSTELVASGSLKPEELALTDRPLFVLLYIMPLNLN
jgi:hypothetical protein